MVQNIQEGYKGDGNFFMKFEDFYVTFNTLEIVHVNVDAKADKNHKNNNDLDWNYTSFRGEWKEGVNSGGIYTSNLFWTNPQHRFSIKSSNCRSAIIISLIQTDIIEKRLAKRSSTSNQNIEALGYYIYSIVSGAVPDEYGTFKKSDLKMVEGSSVFKYNKELVERISLRSGDFVIIPCLFETGKNAKYYLRMYIENYENLAKDSQETDENNSLKKINQKVEPQIEKNSQNIFRLSETNHRGLYDEWYFNGMSRKEIEECVKNGQKASTQLCSLM